MIRLLFLFISLLFIGQGEAHVSSHMFSDYDFERMAKGESFYSSHYATYSRPDSFPMEGKALFCVSVNGKYTGVYSDKNAWDKRISFGYFGLKEEDKATIEVTCLHSFSQYKILPENYKIQSKREGQTIRFKMKSQQNISIVFDEDYQGNSIHLFAQKIEQNLPTPSDSLIYFGPGYHPLHEVLKITGKQKIYIAGGALVDGTIQIENADGAKVYGCGILMKQEIGNLVLSSSFSSNTAIEGIIIHNHRNPGWTVALHAVSHFQVNDVKVVSTRYASTDGFDIVNSNHIRFSHCFIRSCDDAIAIKGLFAGKPADCPPNEEMQFEHLQLWNDCNNAICMGAETRATHYKNISFKDIDVLYSYDDRDNHTQLDERSVMSIICLEGTFFEDIRFEDIRVNQCERLICLTFKDSFWFGTISGDQSTPGGIRNITYKNISSRSKTNSCITNQILLNGWFKEGTPTKYIKYITFQNVNIGGEKMTMKNNKWIQTNNTKGLQLVDNLKFIN